MDQNNTGVSYIPLFNATPETKELARRFSVLATTHRFLCVTSQDTICSPSCLLLGWK